MPLLMAAAAVAYAQTAPYSGLGADSVSPEIVAKFAPQPLDPQFTRSIQAMLDVRSPGLGLIAPKGDKLYFGWRITGTPQVFRLDRPMGFPVQMTGGEDRTGVLAITPDGKTLVLTRDVGGQENPGLYLQSTSGGPLTRVFHAPKVQAFLDFVSDDGRELYFHANDVAPDGYAIYRYDIASGSRTLVWGEKGRWEIADHKGSGASQKLLLVNGKSNFAQEVVEFEPASGRRTPLLGQGEDAQFVPRYAAQPGELLVVTNKFRDFRALYRWKIGSDASQKSFREVLAPAMDVADFSIDHARKHVYAQTNDAGYARLVVLDASTYARVSLPLPASAEQAYAGAPSEDGRFVTIGIQTPQAPRTSYVYDWQKKTMTQWLVPSAPEVDLSTFVPARLSSYPAKDGTKIPMVVRVPKGCAPGENTASDPCPVIVLFHGGPEAQARPGFSPYQQFFVDAGYILVEPNVRGSDGYGKRWLDADNGAKRLEVIGDIEDAGTYVRAQFARNGKAPRVGVMGGSYGGYATLVAMTMFAGTYDAGASIVGISNLASFLRNTAPYRRAVRIAEYGDPDRDAEALRKLSPVTYLDRAKAPLLIIQGVNDPRVPVGEAIQMHDMLEKRGVASPLILFPDEGHGAARRSNTVLELGHVLKFFDENLKPKSG
jgi:dipeptidyl aminopeptidase/acylaminoacyl peptidase